MRPSTHWISLPDGATGTDRLLDAGWFAVAGDPVVTDLVDAFGGQSFTIEDAKRPLYHAAACVAANHVVALLGQVERLAADVGAPREAYLALTRAAVDNVARLGAAAALTGPAARGDRDTVARHLAALPSDEVESYEIMVREAQRLAGEPEAQ